MRDFLFSRWTRKRDRGDTYIPRHRDSKTKKSRHRDSKIKTPRHRETDTNKPRHRDSKAFFQRTKKPRYWYSKTKKPRHWDSKAKKPRYWVPVEFWPLCPLIRKCDRKFEKWADIKLDKSELNISFHDDNFHVNVF